MKPELTIAESKDRRRILIVNSRTGEILIEGPPEAMKSLAVALDGVSNAVLYDMERGLIPKTLAPDGPQETVIG
jgi:hypothetical protein